MQEEINYRKKQQQSFIVYRIMDDGFALVANMMNLIDEVMIIAVKNVGWYAAYDGSYQRYFLYLQWANRCFALFSAILFKSQVGSYPLSPLFCTG